ncbi:MAG: hypothetical protein ACYTG5_03830 [Planctomycetota bacterium]|jgi:hypothetical protein
MKSKSLLVSVLAGSLLLATTAFSPEPAGKSADDTELALHMKEINKGIRGLQKMLKDPEQKDVAIAALSELEGHALAVKSMKPAELANVPEADQGDFMLGYRGAIIELLSTMLEVELAVAEERSEDAMESYKALQKLKNPAHKKFKIKKK